MACLYRRPLLSQWLTCLSLLLLLMPAISRAQSPIPCTGQYKNFEDFKTKNLGSCPMNLYLNPDSTYTFSAPAMGWKYYDADVWGMIDSNGIQYIHMSGEKFLPIQRQGKMSYVYIPTPLVHDYLSGRLEDYKKHTTDYMCGGAMPLVILFCIVGYTQYPTPWPSGLLWAFAGAGAFLIAFDVPIGIIRGLHHHNMVKKAKTAERYHVFAVNMQTGMIQFNKPLKS